MWSEGHFFAVAQRLYNGSDWLGEQMSPMQKASTGTFFFFVDTAAQIGSIHSTCTYVRIHVHIITKSNVKCHKTA